MAKYACPFCDYFVHTSGAIPNPNEFLVWTAVHWDALPNTSINTDTLYSEATPMYKCVSCSALAIFWQGYESSPTWYCEQGSMYAKSSNN
jgi:hypothetical protein